MIDRRYRPEEMDQHHRFVINSIIYTKSSVDYDTIEEVEALISALGFDLLPMPRQALFLVGKAF